MPGVQYEQLYRAMQLADLVSVNLEGPTQERLSSLASKKDFANELLKSTRPVFCYVIMDGMCMIWHFQEMIICA